MPASAPSRVLIVEDNEIFRNLLGCLLGERFPDLEVLEAVDLAEGARKFREGWPGVVLLDLNLPDGNGLVLAEQIRAERPGTCVLVCTSHDLPEYREAATLRGATHFLSKGSLDWVELGDLVEAAFRRSTTVC